MSGEARIVTLLFTDLVGSTELYDRLGDETAESLRRTHFRLLRQAVADRGGREVKNVGDGLMVVFHSSVDAVSCAIDMQEAVDRYNRRPQTLPLDVRIGLHAGEPIHDEEDYFGASVNVARRLCDEALGGQIVASDLVRGLIGGREGFAFRSLGAMELRGIAEPVPASEVVWTPTSAAAFDLPSVFTSAPRTPYVGRSNEREALREEWKRAAIGERRLVLIGGEPGIGKTRISKELAVEAHNEGAIVLYGRCDSEALIPYQPFVEALRHYVASCPQGELREQVDDAGAEILRLVPELSGKLPGLEAAPPLDPETVRFRLFRSVARLLRNAAHLAPVLLVLDDLHWADAPTLAMLKHVVRGDAAPILAVGTYRDVEVGRQHPLAEVLAVLYRERLGERVSLSGLTEGEVVSFIAAAAEHDLDEPGRTFARALHAETQGNPFFIEEILLHLVESGQLYHDGVRWTSDVSSIRALDIPQGVREAVERRLARLSEDTDRALAHAAVLGPHFSYAVLLRMSEMNDDVLLASIEAAIDAQLIVEVPDDSGFAFTHALVRQVLYETPTTQRRQRMHLRAAEAIEAVHGADAPPEALALHYRAAGDAAHPQKAIDASLAASRAAGAVFAYEDAAEHLDAALDLMERHGSDAALRARLLGTYGDLMFVTGLDYGKGIERIEQAARVLDETGDAFGAATMRSRLGRALSTFDTWMDIDKAIELFREAEAVLSTQPESAALAHTYVGLASAALYGLRIDEGITAAARAAAIAERLGRDGIRGTAIGLLGFHLFASGSLAEGERLMDEAWETADRIDHPTLGFITSWMHGFIGELLLDPRLGEEWCDRELGKPRAAEAPTQRVILTLHRDMVRAMRGDLESLATPHEDVGADSYISAAVREQFLTYHNGEWERTAELCRTARDHRIDARNLLEVAATSHTLAWTLRLLDQFDEAEGVLRGCLDFSGGNFLAAEVIERIDLAVACATTGRVEEAREHVDRSRKIVSSGENWRGRAGHVEWSAGVTEAAAGSLELAEASFRRGVELLQRYESVVEEAETFYWWGRTLIDAGRRASGIEKLDTAASIYERIGAGRPFLDRVDAARR
ncbi:MAG TPA: AAA family ATPase [Actinomycetota bacterium]|nr:AAA family ATPase [Actinomycetota bacterium]